MSFSFKCHKVQLIFLSLRDFQHLTSMDLTSILEFQSRDVINIFVPNPSNICTPALKKTLL